MKNKLNRKNKGPSHQIVYLKISSYSYLSFNTEYLSMFLNSGILVVLNISIHTLSMVHL